jgi:hypothetical protein
MLADCVDVDLPEADPVTVALASPAACFASDDTAASVAASAVSGVNMLLASTPGTLDATTSQLFCTFSTFGVWSVASQDACTHRDNSSLGLCPTGAGAPPNVSAEIVAGCCVCRTGRTVAQ